MAEETEDFGEVKKGLERLHNDMVAIILGMEWEGIGGGGIRLATDFVRVMCTLTVLEKMLDDDGEMGLGAMKKEVCAHYPGLAEGLDRYVEKTMAVGDRILKRHGLI